MHIFELCELIRRKPDFFLDGDRSVKRLRSFLVGFETGANSKQGELTGQEDIRQFNSWVASQLGFSNSTSGWCNMILSKAKTDEEAFEVFFDLLDKYRRASGNPNGSAGETPR